jgi:hypothetical protein
MVIVVAADIMCHVMTVIMLAQMYAIVVHHAIMSRQNGMSVIASCRAIMGVGAEMAQQALQVLLVLLVQQVLSAPPEQRQIQAQLGPLVQLVLQE